MLLGARYTTIGARATQLQMRNPQTWKLSAASRRRSMAGRPKSTPAVCCGQAAASARAATRSSRPTMSSSPMHRRDGPARRLGRRDARCRDRYRNAGGRHVRRRVPVHRQNWGGHVQSEMDRQAPVSSVASPWDTAPAPSSRPYSAAAGTSNDGAARLPAWAWIAVSAMV